MFVIVVLVGKCHLKMCKVLVKLQLECLYIQMVEFCKATKLGCVWKKWNYNFPLSPAKYQLLVHRKLLVKLFTKSANYYLFLHFVFLEFENIFFEVPPSSFCVNRFVFISQNWLWRVAELGLCENYQALEW